MRRVTVRLGDQAHVPSAAMARHRGGIKNFRGNRDPSAMDRSQTSRRPLDQAAGLRVAGTADHRHCDLKTRPMTHHGASRLSPIPALARSPYSMTGFVEQWALTGGMGATVLGHVLAHEVAHVLQVVAETCRFRDYEGPFQGGRELHDIERE